MLCVWACRGRCRGSDRDRDGDRGQAMPLAAAMVGLTAVLMLAFVPVGTALDRRTRVRTAADAAALAGAASGSPVDAGRLASANGGELVDFERQGDRVVVEVRVGDMTAHASARSTGWTGSMGGAAGAGGGGAGRGDRAGLAPAMLAALATADALLGRPVPVASGLRTRAEQEALWARRATNPYPVARPGTSDHERGLAIDVPRGFVDQLLSVAAAAGLCHPLPRTDPVHFEVCGR
jgi:hypothetical protein